MRTKTNQPTMKDVAKEAGVALGTVSKVINGIPVGEEYEKKVKDAVEKLGYKINIYAQGLKASKTYNIAFIVPNTTHPYFGLLSTHINKALKERGYKMFLCCTDYDNGQEQEFLEMAERNRVDGIIGLTYSPNLEVNPDIPYVSIDRIINENISCVASDNFAGGALAAQKLHEFGCKKVAFLRIGSDLKNEPNKRRSGFEYGCQNAGLEYQMKIISDGMTNDEFFKFLKEHYHNGKLDFDGLFCVTDTLAIEIIEMLQQLNLKVPQDVQVIGFDGITQYGRPKYLCSTIVQPAEKIAQMAVSLLLQDINTIRPPLVCLPVEFKEGGTTK